MINEELRKLFARLCKKQPQFLIPHFSFLITNIKGEFYETSIANIKILPFFFYRVAA